MLSPYFLIPFLLVSVGFDASSAQLQDFIEQDIAELKRIEKIKSERRTEIEKFYKYFEKEYKNKLKRKDRKKQDFFTPAYTKDFNRGLFSCNFNDFRCRFDRQATGTIGDQWMVTVGNITRRLRGKGQIRSSVMNPILIWRPAFYNQVQCLYYSSYTSRHELHFVISIKTEYSETLYKLPAKKWLFQRVTIGEHIKHPFQLSFHLHQSFWNLNHGHGSIGNVIVKNGPCPDSYGQISCRFNKHLCDWDMETYGHIWYPVPFGVGGNKKYNGLDKHEVEWGALGSFDKNSYLWSPLVVPARARCFSFLYVKGKSAGSYLRVWLLYKSYTGNEMRKALLYEDKSPLTKVFKKRVQINIRLPHAFKIGFEGRSKNLIHGIVILHTSIKEHRCKGFGVVTNLKTPNLIPPAKGKQGPRFQVTTSIRSAPKVTKKSTRRQQPKRTTTRFRNPNNRNTPIFPLMNNNNRPNNNNNRPNNNNNNDRPNINNRNPGLFPPRNSNRNPITEELFDVINVANGTAGPSDNTSDVIGVTPI